MTREIVNEEAERLEAQRKPRAESKNAPVTEEHRRIAAGWTEYYCDHWWGFYCDICTAEGLANLQRRWQAEARLEQHRRECKYCNSGRLYECDTAKMLRELAEANHE